MLKSGLPLACTVRVNYPPKMCHTCSVQAWQDSQNAVLMCDDSLMRMQVPVGAMPGLDPDMIPLRQSRQADFLVGLCSTCITKVTILAESMHMVCGLRGFPG